MEGKEGERRCAQTDPGRATCLCSSHGLDPQSCDMYVCTQRLRSHFCLKSYVERQPMYVSQAGRFGRAKKRDLISKPTPRPKCRHAAAAAAAASSQQLLGSPFALQSTSIFDGQLSEIIQVLSQKTTFPLIKLLASLHTDRSLEMSVWSEEVIMTHELLLCTTPIKSSRAELFHSGVQSETVLQKSLLSSTVIKGKGPTLPTTPSVQRAGGPDL